MDLRIAVPVLLAGLSLVACGGGSGGDDPGGNKRVVGSCGNGVVEGDEACDDGNGDDTDGCTSACALPACGDGFVQGDEECDEGAGNADTGACLANCTRARCGDGFVQAGVEACDDANASNDDACLNTCEKNECGDGFVHDGVEACDDGNDVDDDACSNTCVQATCGDAIRQADEQCDDGNDIETDACTSACLPARCGDGHVQGDEQCDEGERNADTGTCTTLCRLPACGDGHVQGDEQCDDGEDNADTGRCTTACQSARCGDGFVQGAEQCDEGDDNSDTGTCTTACKNPACGDGFLQGDEECDDGPLNGPTAACLTTCASNVCGDGFVHTGVEACDDGALNSDTGACRPGCVENVCGDGFVEAGVEACDEGAANSNTGTCTLACRSPSCGDGFIQGEEACDDGLANSDAPGATCRPSCLLPGCGDGTVDAGEACDDGNLIDTDSCSNACTLNGDTCANPAVVMADPLTHGFTVAGDTSLATPDYGATCTSSNFNGDMVYQFTAPIAGRWRFEMTGVHDMVLSARSTCADDTTEIACSDNGFTAGAPEVVLLDLQQGATLFLIADGYGNSTLNEGSFTITGSVTPFANVGDPCDPTGASTICAGGSVCDTTTLTCRSTVCGDGMVEGQEECDDGNTVNTDACSNTCTSNGDTCAAPAVVTADPATNTFTVNGSTAGKGDEFSLSCSFTGGSGDLVYQFTAPVGGRWRFDLAGSFDMVLGVRSTCADTTNLACADNGFTAGAPEFAEMVLQQNQTVFLVVDGYTDIFLGIPGEGSFTLTGSVVPFVPVGAVCDPTGAANLCETGSQCDPTTLHCVGSICGNGTLESGEQCDDGNQNDGDACSNACTINGDTCAAAAIITADPLTHGFTLAGDTSSAAADYQAGCTVSGRNGDLVYQFTAPVGGRWSFAASATAFDYIIAVQTTCGVPASNLGCEGGFDALPTETVTIDLAANETVFILIDGYGDFTDNEGPFTLSGSVVPWANPGDPCDPTGQTTICARGSQCDPTNLVCVASICGNGTVESGEQCEDLNTVDDDLCSNTCRFNGDTCATAPAIPVDPALLSFSVAGNTTGMAKDYAATCTPTANNGDMFYEFTSPVHALWTFSLTGPEDLVIAATTTCGASGSEIACADGPGDGGTETLQVELAANQTIFLAIDGYDTTTPNESAFSLSGTGLQILPVGAVCDPTGSANRCVHGSQCDGALLLCRVSICGDGQVESGEQCDDANQDDEDACNNACQYNGDTCADPWILPSSVATPGFTVSGDTSVVGANYQLGCTVSGNNGDMIYQLTAPVHGIWKFAVSGTFDTGIAVQAACGNNGTNLACVETGSAGAVDMVELELQAGQTVFILVDGYGDSTANEGTFTLTGTVRPLQPIGSPCDPTGATSLCAFGGVCDTTTLTCVATVCGNGVIEPNGGEECDDQNSDDTDACTNDCKIRGDSCAAPFDLRLADTDPSPQSVTVTGTLAAFNNNHRPTCGTTGPSSTSNYRDVVYALTGNGTTEEYWELTIKSSSSTAVILDVATACVPRNAVLSCTYGATSTSSKTVRFWLGANETIYLWVDTESTTAPGYTITATVKQAVAPGGACDPAGVLDNCGSDGVCSTGGTCIAATCGNGTIEGQEECDDGNVLDNDGCSADCYKEGDTCNAAFDLNAIDTAAAANVWEHAGSVASMKGHFTALCESMGRWGDVVYAFTAPAAGNYRIQETGGLDAVMFASNACAPTAWSPDLACTDSPEEFTLPLAANETVFVFIGPWSYTSTPSSLTYGIRVTQL